MTMIDPVDRFPGSLVSIMQFILRPPMAPLRRGLSWITQRLLGTPVATAAPPGGGGGLFMLPSTLLSGLLGSSSTTTLGLFLRSLRLRLTVGLFVAASSGTSSYSSQHDLQYQVPLLSMSSSHSSLLPQVSHLTAGTATPYSSDILNSFFFNLWPMSTFSTPLPIPDFSFLLWSTVKLSLFMSLSLFSSAVRPPLDPLPSRLTATFFPALLLIFPPMAGLSAPSLGGAKEPPTAAVFFSTFLVSFSLSLLSPAFLAVSLSNNASLAFTFLMRVLSSGFFSGFFHSPLFSFFFSSSIFLSL
mmetsp:Transcript_23036/g.47750  ORF Transcript_23036/g.47750 Transcript_23036/m.47750 type:complete len:300 (-) Transcript_23036:1136-2035(-)